MCTKDTSILCVLTNSTNNTGVCQHAQHTNTYSTFRYVKTMVRFHILLYIIIAKNLLHAEYNKIYYVILISANPTVTKFILYF